jgi:hypothetical protein
MNKYKINSKDIEQIDISVLNVSQNDSGIYQSLSASNNVDGCCLLIINKTLTKIRIRINA